MRPLRAASALLVAGILLATGVASAQGTAPAPPAPSSVLVCVANSAGYAVAPCGSDGSATKPVVQSGFLLTPAEYAAFFQSTQPIDVGELAQFFAYGCTTVIGCWLGSFAIGLVIRGVR